LAATDLGTLLHHVCARHLAAISEGVNTRRKIKGELGITDKDWCIYSQVLKKEGKIECSQQKWSICSGE
ncbi:hypothetical protein, partial [Collinsella sp. AF20-14LB]|uniref:hypothetical protein n=1 Tax=Collinsella sp. AF20-14LB TaxID=2292221 RepID=UPI001F24E13C